MKAQFTFYKTARIVIGYLLLVYALPVIFTSCSIARREGTTSPCNNKNAFAGYGKDNQGRKVHMSTRKTY